MPAKMKGWKGRSLLEAIFAKGVLRSFQWQTTE